MTGTKTYRAGTMREALARVRRDLGGDAVILNTREVRRRRLFGLGARERVEVPAADRAPVAATTFDAIVPASEAIGTQVGERLGRLHAMVSDLSRHGRI